MKSAHKFRFASSCAVVALCCLPCIGTAQRQGRSTQSQETPVFADELTRAALGNIANLNDQVPAGARMTPGPKSHMVVMGAVTDVWCPPGSFIEMDPDLKVEGFKPISVAVWEDGVRTQAHGLDETYTLRVNPPVGGVNRKRVNVVLYDALGHAQTVMQCTVRSRISNPAISVLDYKEHDEKCGFAIKDRQSFTNTCLYLGDMYLGRVGDNAGKVDMDARLLPPGKYTCQMAGQNADGIYVPGASSEFTVPSRYSIDCGESAPSNIVIGEHDEKLKITVTHTSGLSIKKTRVYIAGIKAGEKEGDSFTIDLPMKKVPSGNCFIEVIGVAEDGVTYPVESLQLKVKNEAWWSEISHTTEFENITANQEKIDKLWQDVCTNLERARYEPDIYRDSRTFTLESITDHYTVGKSAEFQAAAKTAFIQMTQLQMKSAKLYRALDLRSSAMSMFHRVWQELGSSSADGGDAKRALDALRKDASSTL